MDQRSKKLSRPIGVFAALILLVGVLGNSARALSPISIDHQPPAEASAGDPLELNAGVQFQCPSGSICTPPKVTAHYRNADGELEESSGTGSSTIPATVTLSIPGSAVRFPSLAYYLTASVSIRPEGTPASVCSIDPAVCGTASARFPLSGDQKLDVVNVIRVGFKRPDGTPASGLRVTAAGVPNGSAWEATTDLEGMLRLRIPSENPWIAAKAADPGYGILILRAFDSWPADPVQPGETLSVSGQGTTVGLVLNLGEPLLDAVDLIAQDQTFVLRDQEMTFVSPSTVGCVGGEGVVVCSERIETIWNVNVPLAINVGGGVDMSSRYEYGSSAFTGTTFLVKAGAGWIEGEGEVSSEQQRNHVATSGNHGPGSNRTAFGQFNYVRERTRTCSIAYCDEYEDVRPYEWNSGFFTQASGGRHDQARQFAAVPGSDCVVRHEGEYKNEVAKGERNAYSISVGGQIHGLSARTKFTKENATGIHSLHTWWVSGTSYQYHHRFVPNGIVDANNDEKNRCPDSHPGITWTDAASYDKTVPSGAPKPSHTVNGIYHGIYRTTSSGADRLHAWTEHNHGRLYAAVWLCSGDPTCDDPFRHSFGCENYSSSGGHVHCDHWSDDYSFGYAVTYWDQRPNSRSCDVEAEAAWPQYTDNHGICWHMMRDLGPGGPD